MKRYIYTLALVVLSGCATTSVKQEQQVETKPVMSAPPPVPAVAASPAPVMPPPSPPPASMPPDISAGSAGPTTSSPNLGFSGPILLTREYLYPSKKAEVPSNYILFPVKPVNQDYRNKYEFVCKLWQASFSIREIFDRLQESDVRAVPFYWMSKKKLPKEDCDKVVENYDYDRAKLYAIKKKLDPTKTYLVCELPDGIVTMDISTLKEEDDVILAMETWIKHMRTLPKAGKQIRPYDLMSSAKAVLGALGTLVAMK